MSQFLEWTPDLSVGIDVIDGQHKRIVDYVNQLHEARIRRDRGAIAGIIEELVDYTLSHFSFEEVMMEQANYRFLKAHQKIHALFIRRVESYQQRFKSGEDVETVATDMQATLVAWLMNHIRREDMDYAEPIRAALGEGLRKPVAEEVGSGWLVATLQRIFGSRR